jgi:hypothetical protein
MKPLNKFWRWVVLESVAPFVLVGVGVQKTYHFLFRESILRRSREGERQFARDIQRDLKFLFDDYSGRIVPDDAVEYPLPFDFAFVIVGLDNLFFRFFRGRDAFEVWVAPSFAPKEWAELQWVLSRIGRAAPFEPREFLSLEDIANLLKPRMTFIREAFSPEQYPEIERHLSDMRSHERAVARQLSSEINRRIQGE